VDALEKARRELLASYARVFETADGKKILSDLVKFCAEVDDANVRAGRMDVICRILKRRDQATDLKQEPRKSIETRTPLGA
jgi:hypothetical protein